MLNKLTRILKTTILSVIVAFLLVVIFFLGVKIFFGQQIEEVITLAGYITIEKNNKDKNQEIKFDPDVGLVKYPEYESKYANIEIEKINIKLPVYYGDTMEVLKKGVGHSSGSYFPGEGGSIVYMGHNSKNVFRNFSKLKIGDKIKIDTSYGKFTYKIYDMKVISETDFDELPIQKDKEILMVYTCYPFKNIGYTTKRYVVYAELEK